ncbi:unnamed protein product [Amaranthus hypochondriacus]
MDSSKQSNKISDIVRLKQMLKKWRKQAHDAKTANNTNSSSSSTSSNTKKGSLSRNNSIKGITFLKRTLSFTDLSAGPTVSSNGSVPKGFLAVDVGEARKRFVIPTNYLSHQAFSVLLKEAEEEFGFQQEGVLRIPCEVDVFEHIMKMVEGKSNPHGKPEVKFSVNDGSVCGSLETQCITQSNHPPRPMCR